MQQCRPQTGEKNVGGHCPSLVEKIRPCWPEAIQVGIRGGELEEVLHREAFTNQLRFLTYIVKYRQGPKQFQSRG